MTATTTNTSTDIALFFLTCAVDTCDDIAQYLVVQGPVMRPACRAHAMRMDGVKELMGHA